MTREGKVIGQEKSKQTKALKMYYKFMNPKAMLHGVTRMSFSL